jgi:hypothetical protein
MVLAVAHLFGFYNPKQLADFLEVPHQQFYTELKDWSVYHVKKMLLRFMVKQAAEKLKPVMSKSAATRSRAGTTLSIDNSVMDRFGKLLRCTWSWYSGRYHKVIRGQDLLGLVLTIHHIAFPLYLLFCPKQGRYHTTKADLLICMLTQLKTAFLREGNRYHSASIDHGLCICLSRTQRKAASAGIYRHHHCRQRQLCLYD